MSEIPTFNSLNADSLRADRDWWRIYHEVFPANEREPNIIIVQSITMGGGLALRASIENRTAAIATIQLLRSVPAVFLIYLGVDPAAQGQGLGAALFEYAWQAGNAQLAQAGLDGLGYIWEVDSIIAGDEPEARKRARRIEFFQRQGGQLLASQYWQPPVDGVNTVPMSLMFRPAGALVINEQFVETLVRAIYLEKYRDVNGIDEVLLMKLLQARSAR
jgi:GNAT superfamily N-acetyltransferase